MNRETNLEDLISRITAIIDEETELLRNNDTSQLESYCEKKNIVLLEFIRIIARLDMSNGSSGVFAGAGKLKAAVERNQSVLKKQLAAVNEFVSFLESEVRREETDGTYGRSLNKNGSYQW